MTETDVNAILVRLAGFEARVTGQIDALGKENTDAEIVHRDHETRLRGLEQVRFKLAGAMALGGLFAGATITVLFEQLAK